MTNDFADRAPCRPVIPWARSRWLRAGNGARPPGLLPDGTAGSDSGKATTSSRVMRRGPFHHHHQPARSQPPPPVHFPHPCRAATRGTLSRPWPTGASRALCSSGPCVTTGCTATSSSNLRRTGNCLARERAMGNEVVKNRSVIPTLTLSNAREPSHRGRPRLWATYMRAANGYPVPRAQPPFAAAAASKVQRLKRGRRLSPMRR